MKIKEDIDDLWKQTFLSRDDVARIMGTTRQNVRYLEKMKKLTPKRAKIGKDPRQLVYIPAQELYDYLLKRRTRLLGEIAKIKLPESPL